jgi:hypothetical protein
LRWKATKIIEAHRLGDPKKLTRKVALAYCYLDWFALCFSEIKPTEAAALFLGMPSINDGPSVPLKDHHLGIICAIEMAPLGDIRKRDWRGLHEVVL